MFTHLSFRCNTVILHDSSFKSHLHFNFNKRSRYNPVPTCTDSNVSYAILMAVQNSRESGLIPQVRNSHRFIIRHRCNAQSINTNCNILHTSNMSVQVGCNPYSILKSQTRMVSSSNPVTTLYPAGLIEMLVTLSSVHEAQLWFLFQSVGP